MSKTANRVLAMVLTVLMLVSMLPGISLAAAQPFATAYNGTVISKSALLVDSSITEANGATIDRTWDGKTYSFTVGTNAFKSVADAYAKGVSNPDIIVLKTTETKIIAKTASRIFTPAWNTLPMKEMDNPYDSTVSFNALVSEGADWTVNADYDKKTIAAELVVDGSISGTVGFYGFTLNAQAKIKGTGSSTVRSDPNKKVTMNFVNSAASLGDTVFELYYANANEKDTLYVQNMRLDKIGTRFLGDGQIPAYTTFDGLYINFDKLSESANIFIKPRGTDTKTIFKNSNFRGTTATHFAYGGNTTPSAVASYEFINNVVRSHSTAHGTPFSIEFKYLTSVVLKENFFMCGHTAATNLLAARSSSTATKVTVENNVFLGYSGYGITASNATTTAKNNFLVKNYETSLNTYKNSKGFQFFNSTNAYYVDYADIEPGRTIKSTSISGASVSEEYKTITVFADASSKEVVKASNITPNASNATVELYSDAACTELLESYALNSISNTNSDGHPSTWGIKTLYVKIYYKNSSSYPAKVYRLLHVNPKLASFNDMLKANGVSMKGITFTSENTMVYLPKNAEVSKDGYIYASIAPHGFKFKVENNIGIYAYDSSTEIPNTGKQYVLLPSGNYGDLKITWPTTILGSNFGTNPNDKSIATAENDFDWGFNASWDRGNTTKINLINIKAGVAGELTINGIELNGAIDDEARTTSSAALKTTFTNSIVNQNYLYTAATANGQNNHNGNYNKAVFYLENGRAKSSTAFDNQDLFSILNVRIEKVRSQQLIDEFIYDITIDGMYSDATASNQDRSSLVFAKTGLAGADITIKNSNFRNGTDTNPFFLIYGTNSGGYKVGKYITTTIENNIFYNAVNGTGILLGPSMSSNSSYIVKNNIAIDTRGTSTFFRPSNYGNATASNSPTLGNITISNNRLVGFTKDNIINTANNDTNYTTISFGDNTPVLRNSFYSPNPNAHKRPAGITGGYSSAIGTTTTDTVTTENAYFLDYNMTKSSASYKNAPTLDGALASGFTAGGVNFNSGDTQAYLPKYVTAPNTEGYQFFEFGNVVYKVKANGTSVIANNGATLTSLTKAKVIFLAGEYGQLNITKAGGYYGANTGFDPNDRKVATAENKYDWGFAQKWDIDDSTEITKIEIQSGVSGTLHIEGVEITDSIWDQKRPVSNAALNFTIKNSVYNKVSGALATSMFVAENGPRFDSSTTMSGNTDTLTIKNLHVMSAVANQLFNEENYPRTVIDGLYWDQEKAGTLRGHLGFHKIYGTPSSPSFTIKNSNIRVGEEAASYAVLNLQVLPNGTALEISNNIFYFNKSTENLLLYGATTGGVAKINNNTIIADAFNKLTTSSTTFASGSQMSGNRFVGIPAASLTLNNLAFTNTYFSPDLASLERPTAITGEYLSAMGTNPYYLDFNMTKLSTSVTESFNDALAAGLTIGGVTFNKDNTAVYLPKNATNGKDVVFTFAGKTYRFTIDNVNVFANTGSSIPANVTAKENVILPAGKYGDLKITDTAKFYGSNFGINPNNKENATEANNFEWEFNEAWNLDASTIIDAIYVQKAVTGSELVFDGVEIIGWFDDEVRTTSDVALKTTIVNTVVNQSLVYSHKSGNGGWNVHGSGYNHAVIYLENARAKSSTAFNNQDKFTFKDSRIIKAHSNQLVDEYVYSFEFDGVYCDAAAAGKARGSLAFLKTGSDGADIVVKNSNFRNGTDASPFMVIYGATKTGANDYIVDDVISTTVENNVLYNAVTGGGIILGPSMSSNKSYVVKNNIVISQNTANAAFFGPSNYGGASTSNSPAMGNIVVDNNSIIGFSPERVAVIETGYEAQGSTPLDYGVILTNTFYSLDNNTHNKPDAILGDYAPAMGENEFYLNYARTLKNTSSSIKEYADYVMQNGIVAAGNTWGYGDCAVYLPKGGLKDGSMVREYNGIILRFTVSEIDRVYANNDYASVEAYNKEVYDAGYPTILPSGTYGTITVKQPVYFAGSNSGVSPNVKHSMTTADAKTGFDWKFNPNWDLDNATTFGQLVIDKDVAAGDLTFDGVVFTMYVDNRRDSTNVLNATILNSVVINGGDGNAVIHTDSPHAKQGKGNDSFTIKDCYVKSMKSNQFVHEFNVPNFTIDGLYLDAAASGKKRSVLSFFKFSANQTNTLTIKNSNFRNGTNGNSLFTVSGAAIFAADGSYSYVETNKVSVTIENNVLYNCMGNSGGAIFTPYADSIGKFAINKNIIIDTKGAKMFEIGNANATTPIKGSVLDGKITITNNSFIGVDSHNLNLELGFNTNPVLNNTYYSSLISGLSDVNANTGMKHEGMTGTIYADVARKYSLTNFTTTFDVLLNGSNNTNSNTLEKALANAKSGDTITLAKDITLSEVIIAPGVKLELNGKKLTTDYVNGFNGSDLVDSSVSKSGKLVAKQGTVKLAKDNDQMPLYDAKKGYYVFTTIQMTDANGPRYDYGVSAANRYRYYPFLYQQGNIKERTLSHGILKSQYEASGVVLGVRLTYDVTSSYTAYQDYIFVNEYVSSYVSSSDDRYASTGQEMYQKLYVGFTQPLLNQGANTKIYSIAQSDTGVEMVSAAINVG